MFNFLSLFCFLLCPVSSAGPNITLEGRYHCYQGPPISLDRLCDFTRDCPLGDDEGDHCRKYHRGADQPFARRLASTTSISGQKHPSWSAALKVFNEALVFGPLRQQLEISRSSSKKKVLRCLASISHPRHLP